MVWCAFCFYTFYRVSVLSHKCESLLLGNYSSYWDETLRLCRSFSTSCLLRFSKILNDWKAPPSPLPHFQNSTNFKIFIYGPILMKINWYIIILYMCDYKGKVKFEFLCILGCPVPTLVKFKKSLLMIRFLLKLMHNIFIHVPL